MICAERLGSLIFWGVNLIAFIAILGSAPTIRSVHHPNVGIAIFASLLVFYRLFRDYWMAEITRLRGFAGPMVKIELEGK